MDDDRMNMSLDEIILKGRDKNFKKVSGGAIAKSPIASLEGLNPLTLPLSQPTVTFSVGSFQNNLYKRKVSDRKNMHFHPYHKGTFNERRNQKRVWNSPYRSQNLGDNNHNGRNNNSKHWNYGGNSQSRYYANSPGHQQNNWQRNNIWTEKNWTIRNDRMSRSSSVCSTDSRRSFGSTQSLASNHSNRSRASNRSFGKNSVSSFGSFQSSGGQKYYGPRKQYNNNNKKGRCHYHRWFPSRGLAKQMMATLEEYLASSSPSKLLKTGNIEDVIVKPKTCYNTLNERFQMLCHN